MDTLFEYIDYPDDDDTEGKPSAYKNINQSQSFPPKVVAGTFYLGDNETKEDETKEEQYVVMNTDNTKSHIFSKRVEAIDFIWNKLRVLVDNKNVEEPNYIYNIQFENDNSISVTKRYKNYLISYDTNVVTYFIRQITNLNN